MHRCIYFATQLGVNLGMFYKRRDYTRVVNGRNPIVDHQYLGESVEGKDVFIADDIIASMSDDIFHVSDATVYNTLQLFTRAGILRRHSIGSKPALYENLTAPRAGAGVQLVCTECGAIKTARDPEVDRLLASRRYPSFSRSYYTLHVYGLCSRCARRKNRSATPKNQ